MAAPAATIPLVIGAGSANYPPMNMVSVSLTEELRAFVEARVADKGYLSSDEYIRDLIRRDQDREHLRGLLLEGAASPPAAAADEAYFAGLRARIRDHRSD